MMKTIALFIAFNISFFSLFYVVLNATTIYNDMFTSDSIDTLDNKNELSQPTFTLYRGGTNTDYKSFPGKDLLEDSIQLLQKVSINEDTNGNKKLPEVETISALTVNTEKKVKVDTILDLSYDMSKDEWDKYKDETHIVIPTINIDAPINFPSIEEYDLEDKILKLLEDGVVHRPETQLPTQNGNFFLIGHSSNYPWIKSKYNNIFAGITKLKEGDKVYVYYKGRKFVYVLYTTFIVPPTSVDVYGYIPGNNLTLMTCYPIGTDKNRFIARFKLQKP